jgi:putative membrane-bound dehydrogenase-like protein
MLPVVCLATILAGWLGADPQPLTGPVTEKRFPPLKVPPGFKATLFACDPLVEYPSVIALGPRPGTLFVAADFMTGLGTEIVRRDEIRLIEDTDGDGYADKSTVYADGFNSIQGLAYHDGTVYVMHAPFLTALRDTKGTGKADERRDLLTGLGLPPEQNPVRLHCANGVVVGHDGWLYLALGDHGCDVKRPEGDRLVLQGGGILRCRPDGRDLHVFATGLRNIYDVALDEDLNVFVRDNENDGGAYKIRVCHSFFGADHGYPYLYYEHPDEALPPLADLGLGSSAGGVCYLERQFPPEYRGNLFFCEWGRSIVRYRPERKGSGFAPVKEIEFAAGADNDPYGFKPTDIVVHSDGSMFVSDWADGQRPKRGRGRIYHIAAVGAKTPAAPMGDGLERWIAQLDSESYAERCQAQQEIKRRGAMGREALSDALRKKKVGVRGRLHAVWLLIGSQVGTWDVLDLANSDTEPRVRAQAVRALVDLMDPVLSRHRLDAAPLDAEVTKILADMVSQRDDRVRLELIVALGRCRWAGAPDWLHKHLGTPDAALAHAAMQTLRRSQNWPALLKLLDEPDTSPIRAIALRAVSGQSETVIVDGLLDRLKIEKTTTGKQQYADALTRVHKKPAPWVYWGFRPAPRPANSVAWERTATIETALDQALADPDKTVRLAVLRAMQREKVPVRLGTLGQWLREETQAEAATAILESLRDQPAPEARAQFRAIVQNPQHTAGNRLLALELFVKGLDAANEAGLLELAAAVEDGPVMAETLRRLGQRPKLASVPLLVRKSSAPSADVRAAAVEALAELKSAEAVDSVQRLLDDKDARVRQAAAAAAGKLLVKSAVEPLLKLATDADAGVRRASLDALRRLREPRVVPLAVTALTDRATELQALECLADLGGPAHAQALTDLAKRSPSTDVLSRVVRLLANWCSQRSLTPDTINALNRSIAEVQGTSGMLLRWRTTGPLTAKDATALIEAGAKAEPETPRWTERILSAGDLRVRLAPNTSSDADVWLGLTDVAVADATPVQVLAGVNGTLHVWLNGKMVHQRTKALPFQPDAERFSVTFAKGVNRLLIQVSGAKSPEFQVRFRRQSAKVEHERLTQAALTRSGDPERGRKLFLDADKSLCTKCHRIGEQGERIGPELTGIGGRFSRVYIVESILEPSRTIAPSFETVAIVLKNGKALSGVKVAETDKTVTLGDAQGQKHVLNKTDIDEGQVSPVSTMPEGLEKRFTEEEFVDLIAFLVSQKEARGR